jgi:hypothetical protein
MITLQLKQRTTKGMLHLEVSEVTKILKLSEATAGRQLVKMFEGLQESVHDKNWLEMIVNWSPPEGLPMTEMTPWLKLAERVNEVETEGEWTIALSKAQAELIYERLKNPKFKIQGLNPALAAFLLDFYDKIGKHPDDLTEDLMFDGSDPVV